MGTNYERGIIKQVEELTLRNEFLEKENRKLSKEKRELSKYITDFEASLERRIEAAIKNATEPLLKEIAEKNKRIEKLEAEVARLKAIINKDSGNSSKPPSQDGFKRIPNSREKSGRKSGGQVGHPGKRLELPPNLDYLVERGTVRREIVDHTDNAPKYITRHVIDIDISLVVTEHRYHQGDTPPGASVVYGDKIKSLVVMLSTQGIIAQERLSEFFNEITSGAVTLSDATIEKFLSDLAVKLKPELKAIETDLLNNPVFNVDETPGRCTQRPDYSNSKDGLFVMERSEGKSFNAYIRTHSNETSTLYTVNPQKDIAGVERDGILPRYIGTLVHDHEAKFYNYATLHATCGAHLLRELRGLFELQKIPWADEMRKFISGMNKHKKNDLAVGRQSCDTQKLSEFLRTYDALIEKGQTALALLKEKELGHRELRRMLKRLKDFKDCYFLFLKDYKVPFTNNLAERDLRPCKTKQKVSGCFRSWAGITRYAAIRSFISTLKKRSYSILDSIFDIFSGVPVLAAE